MGSKSRYQDWKVWKDAVSVGVRVMELELPELMKDQVKQTAISISCKIAEGATGDKLSYQRARKATARLETYLIILHELDPVNGKYKGYESILSTLQGIQAQLGALVSKLSYRS